ncbi:hypothetical protein SAMD00019534_097430, partial [Acytostelium subglobosum LB1]|uniref:hypothetical protein n=1 Tax=Acytostelium subglobosum LB1 TaxID=1410327 RepID=UPI00064512D5
MDFFFNCSSCNTNYNFQESYCKYCLTKITTDQTRVFELIENVIEKRAVNTAMKRLIEDHLESHRKDIERETKMSYIIGRRAQLSQLKQKNDTMKQEIEADHEMIEAKKRYLSSRRNLLKKNKATYDNSDKSECTLLPERIERIRLDLNDNRMKLTLRRRQVIDQITNQILPIMQSPVEPDNVIIVNIVINDKKLQKYPKDIVSATLGYIVKLTDMIATVLSIPLPHKMRFIGSKSTIQQNQRKQQYPLYFNNKTKTRDYQKSLFLLGENISYLRFQQGILTPADTHLHFLHNLVELLASPNLGSSGPFTYQRLASGQSPATSTQYTTLDEGESKEEWEFIDFFAPTPDQPEEVVEQLERIL